MMATRARTPGRTTRLHLQTNHPRSLAAAVLVAVSLLALPALAGTTGKLQGRVLDAKKQPLIGVNVTIPAARAGAMTDEQGRYQILNIPSGSYDVKFQLLGYQPVSVAGQLVSADNTATLDVSLKETPIAMQEVVVNAERPVVDLKSTSSLAAVSRKDIQNLPVQELNDIVSLQAGVTTEGSDLHFRGGRSTEVQYQVDGVSVNNAYDNKSSLRIDRSLLEEVQVVSGTFDAEYGQAMSGVVNAVLRRGTEQFRWNAELMGGGYAFNGEQRLGHAPPAGWWNGMDGKTFETIPGAQRNAQLSFSGPTFFRNTVYLLSGRYDQANGSITARHVFTPWLTSSGHIQDKVANPDGDGSEEPLGYTKEWSGVGKITNRSIKNVELNYQAIWDNIDARREDWNWRLNPDGMTKQHTFSIAHGLDITHTLSPKTYYDVSVRQNYFDYKDLAYDDIWDPRYDKAGQPQNVTDYQYDAIVQGVDLTRFEQSTNTALVKSTFTSQFTHDQQFKAGMDLQWPRVRFGAPGGTLGYASVNGTQQLVRRVSEPPNFPDIQTYVPYFAAAYAQDEGEWNDLRVRAGLRFDYVNPKSSVPSDLANPAGSIPGYPPPHLVATTRKYSLSPRVGVSYPVTKDAALFFSYGHFVQFPALSDVFNNADYRVLADLQSEVPFYTVMGNPDIKPEHTVQYEFGYKQRVTDWLGLDASMFYKDVRDLLGVEFIETYNGAEYPRFTNVDFGNISGITLALDQRRRGIFTTSLDYSWQVAQGNSSDPRESATRAQNGQDPRPRQQPFNWDQRHTFNATVIASKERDFSLSTVIRIASGQPYTPVQQAAFGYGLATNSGRKPIASNVDLRAEKYFRAGKAGMQVFGRIFNVFDSRFLNGYVFDSTGSPYYARDPAHDKDQLANPTRYYGPRRIELGISMAMGE